MYNESQLFGVPMSEVKEAVLFHQRFKDTPTYKETLKKIKREHLEQELVKIETELDRLNNE